MRFRTGNHRGLDFLTREFRLELADVVAQGRGFLEVHVLGRLPHVQLQVRDASEDLVAAGVLAGRLEVNGRVVAANDLADALGNRHRRDVVGDVVRLLQHAAAVGLGDGVVHRGRHAVAVENDRAVQIAGGASNGLDQAALTAQEAGLVGVQNRHEADLGEIQTLAQEVNADQHIEVTQPEIADDLLALHRVDFTVQIPRFEVMPQEILGQVFAHALGQRCHQHALVHGNSSANHAEQILDLTLRGSHLDFRVKQPRRADDLIDNLARDAALVIGRRG